MNSGSVFMLCLGLLTGIHVCGFSDFSEKSDCLQCNRNVLLTTELSIV